MLALMAHGSDLFVAAAALPDRVVLEGFHALKHALRFGAQLDVAVASKPFDELIASLAPDLAEQFTQLQVKEISTAALNQLPGRPHPTGIAAVAVRPPDTILKDLPHNRPVVVLDDPQHHGNIGASVRVSAAAGTAGLITVGRVDPWTPEALRGSAGLHFAIPVQGTDALPSTDRPLYAFDADGDPLGSLPDDAVLVFGSERNGLSPWARERADHIVSFPMEPGVSSMNLATSVAVATYAWRLNHSKR